MSQCAMRIFVEGANTVVPPWSISVEEEAPDEDSISNRLGKINNKDCGIVKINAVTFCSDNRAIDVGA